MNSDIAGTPNLSRRTAIKLLASGAGMALLAACSAPTSSPSASTPAASTSGTPASAPASQPKAGGVMNTGQPYDIAKLDGHSNSYTSSDNLMQVFEGLTYLDANLTPQPQLAESWDLASDFTQIKLKLRQGVKWHSGRELTSADVKYSLDRISTPGVSSLGFMGRWFTSETPDPYTIVLSSDQPRPSMFHFFEYWNIVDQASLEGPDAANQAIGTGPFVFQEWVPGDHLTFSKNKDYWGKPPNIDGLMVRIYKDLQTMTAAFEAGAIDVMDFPAGADAIRLRSDPQYSLMANPASYMGATFLINTLYPPLDNKAVRQAVNYAINRPKIVETILVPGLDTPSSLPWPTSSPAYDAGQNATYTYDLDKAKSLLASAGVSGGTFDLSYATRPDFNLMAQVWAADLATLGFQVNLLPLDTNGWQAKVNAPITAGNPPDYRGLTMDGGETGAQSSPVWALLGGNHEGPTANISGYRNDTYASLVDAVTKEVDSTKLKALYKQLNDMILDESFSITFAMIPHKVVSRVSKVQGISFGLHENIWFKDAWLA